MPRVLKGSHFAGISQPRMVASPPKSVITKGKTSADYFQPLQSGDVLESTPFHYAACGTTFLALIACCLKIIYLGTFVSLGATGFAALGAAFVAGVEFADFGTGIYHWGCDNYGDRNT